MVNEITVKDCGILRKVRIDWVAGLVLLEKSSNWMLISV